jgi:hypothetical protein
MQKSNRVKKTGEDWSLELNITVVDPVGWPDRCSFYNLEISKLEFLSRASSSIVETKVSSRREANSFKRTLA